MSVTSESKQEQVDPFVRKLLVGEPVYVDDVHLKERVAMLVDSRPVDYP